MDEKKKKKGKKRSRGDQPKERVCASDVWLEEPDYEFKRPDEYLRILSRLEKIGVKTSRRQATKVLKRFVKATRESYLDYLARSKEALVTAIFAGRTEVEAKSMTRIHALLSLYPVKVSDEYTAAFYTDTSTTTSRTTRRTDVSGSMEDILSALRRDTKSEPTEEGSDATVRWETFQNKVSEFGMSTDDLRIYTHVMGDMAVRMSYHLKDIVSTPIYRELVKYNTELPTNMVISSRYLYLEERLLALLLDTEAASYMQIIVSATRKPTEKWPDLVRRITTAHDDLLALSSDAEKTSGPHDSISYLTVWTQLASLMTIEEHQIMQSAAIRFPRTRDERNAEASGQTTWTDFRQRIGSIVATWPRTKGINSSTRNTSHGDSFCKTCDTSHPWREHVVDRNKGSDRGRKKKDSTTGGPKKRAKGGEPARWRFKDGPWCSKCSWTINPTEPKHKTGCMNAGQAGDLKSEPSRKEKRVINKSYHAEVERLLSTQQTRRDKVDRDNTTLDPSTSRHVHVVEKRGQHESNKTTSRSKRSRSSILRTHIPIYMRTSDGYGTVPKTVLLDTGADCNIAPRELLHNVRTHRGTVSHLTSGTKCDAMGQLFIPQVVGYTVLECYAHPATATECDLLLGIPAIIALGADLSAMTYTVAQREAANEETPIVEFARDARHSLKRAPTHTASNLRGDVFECVLEHHSDIVINTKEPLEQIRLKDGTPVFATERSPTENDADILSVFSGPTSEQARVAREEGLCALEGLDLLSAIPWDIFKSTDRENAIKTLERRRPRLVLFAPPCTAWSILQRMSTRPEQTTRLGRQRDQQRTLLRHVLDLVRTVQKYGGAYIVENPDSSALWRQSVMQSILTGGGISVTTDLCTFGLAYKKPTRFFVNAPEPHLSSITGLLDRRCQGGTTHTHLECRGTDVDGVNHSAKAGCYPTALLRTFAAAAYILRGRKDISGIITRIARDTQTSREKRMHLVRDSKMPEHGPTALIVHTIEADSDEGGEPTHSELNLARDKLRLFWRRQTNTRKAESKHNGFEDITFGSDVPDSIREEMIRHMKRQPQVIEHYQENKIALCVKATPVKIRLRSNYKPQRQIIRNWGREQDPKRRILTEWAEEKLRTGEYVRVEDSEWCSRPHIALKPNHSDPDNFGIRICGDYVAVNSQCLKTVTPQINAVELIDRASGHHYYFSLDEKAQYTGYALDPASQELATLCTPIGMIRPTRLQFGLRNAGAYCQLNTDRFRAEDLSRTAYDHSARYADDTVGWSDITTKDGRPCFDWHKFKEEFLEHYDSAVKRNVSLGPKKMEFGISEVTFYGHILNRQGNIPAEHVLEPIRRMSAPRSTAELQRVLGLVNGFKNRIPRLATMEKPLNKLRHSTSKFEWGGEQQEAFDKIKAACLNTKILGTLEPNQQVFVASDASDDGYGGIVYQLEDPNGRDEATNRRILRVYSKAWKNERRRYPPYYLEAIALLAGLTKAREFSDCTPYPVVAYTDHLPLTYIKKSSRGPVSAWRIENLAGLDYHVRYRPGAANIIPDALSRYPVLGPQRLSGTGIQATADKLLEHITLRKGTHVWIHLGPNARGQQNELQKRIRSRGCTTSVGPIRSAMKNKGCDIVISIPPAGTSTVDARTLIRSGKRCAILIPTDSAHFVAQNDDKSYDTKLQQWVERSSKISLMFPLLTWLVDPRIGMTHDHVYGSEAISDTEARPKTDRIPPPTHEWAKEQRSFHVDEAKDFRSHPVLYTPEGLMLISETDTSQMTPTTVIQQRVTARVYVPPSRRRKLIKRVHVDILKHLGPRKVSRQLLRTFIWPALRRDVRSFCASCKTCRKNNARRNWSHGLYRGLEGGQPRTRWGMDFYATNAKGSGKQILGMIDLDSLYVELYPSTNRTAETVCRGIEERILFRHGTPTVIHSDHAKEFISRAAKELARRHKYKPTTTLGYNPRGNSVIESFWRFLGKCLRNLTDNEYATLDRYLMPIQWAWNISPSESTSVTPYEIEHGCSAINMADAPFVRSPTDSKVQTDKIFEAATAFRTLARNHADHERQIRADLLNKGSRKTRRFIVGDQVYIFIPPTEADITRSGRKAKHLCHWRGPFVIHKVLSTTTYTITDTEHKYFYSRNISNIRSAGEVTGSTPRSECPLAPCETTNDFAVLDFLFVREPENTWHSIVRITKISEVDGYEAEIYGNVTGNRKADIKKVYTKHGQTLYHYERGALPFTMTIEHDEASSLFRTHRIAFDKSQKRLSQQTLQYITDTNLDIRLQHHRTT